MIMKHRTPLTIPHGMAPFTICYRPGKGCITKVMRGLRADDFGGCVSSLDGAPGMLSQSSTGLAHMPIWATEVIV